MRAAPEHDRRRITFRVATRPDAPALAALHADSWRRTYRGLLTDEYLDGAAAADREALWIERLAAPAPNQQVVIAESDGRIAGFACAFGAHDAEWGTLLENLHVAQAFKSRGLGVRLMSEVARWSLAAHPGCRLHLWALEGNTGARRFYERLGGRITGHDTWAAPGGAMLPELRYAWLDPRELVVPRGHDAAGGA